MKLFVKTLKGTHFEIEVKPADTVADLKKNIETMHGPEVYPAAQQMLIYQGKVLNDSTTIEANQVADRGFVVIMLTKNKATSVGASSTSNAPANLAPPTSSPSANQPSTAPQAPRSTAPESIPAATPPTAPPASSLGSDIYGQAASNRVAGNNAEVMIQQILDMGGGSWDRDAVARALRAAYNNPERAVDYLYSGIPDQDDVPPVVRAPSSGQAANPPNQPAPSSGPNANPLNLFPQGLPNLGSNAGAGTLDALRNNQQFEALQRMVQTNPQILQPMLQELGKQNPQLRRLIQEHQGDFLRLINEPLEEGNIPAEVGAVVPESLEMTHEEHAAVERLEAMGFNRAIVLEVFIACNKNEELAANYLLDHGHEYEE